MKSAFYKRLGVAGLAAAATIALAGCGGVADPNAGTESEEEAVEAAMVSPLSNLECSEGVEPTGEPIVIGGSLSLTGALGGTGVIHEAVGEIVVDWINDCGGIDGRPIEYRLLDDQSTPAQAATNYERLLAEGVDLVMGPYGGATALAAAGPVIEAGYAFPTHTNGAFDQDLGDHHFPSWQTGRSADAAGMYVPGAQAFIDAINAGENEVKTVFMATSKFPTTLGLANAQARLFEEQGFDVVENVEYELGTSDFSSIATRMLAADADLVWLGAVGLDIANMQLAFDAVGYTPRNLYASFSGPGAVASLGGASENVLVSSIYEDNPPLNQTDIAKYFTSAWADIAKERDLFPVLETQAAASFGAWQILLTAAQEVGVDNAAIVEWLNANEVETLSGVLNFDGFNNIGTDLSRITQVQDGKRVLVWPEDVAGSSIRVN